jgi:transketolase
VRYGGYIIKDCEGDPDLLLIATGSEVAITLDAANLLSDKNIRVRVVSMPSTELFEKQTDDYKKAVLPDSVTNRLAVEAASPFGWDKYVGVNGDVIGIESFGASAPGEVMMEKFGFTVENIANRALSLVQRNRGEKL